MYYSTKKKTCNYTGHVTITSFEYNKTAQTVMCISTGGPATDVNWSKDGEKIHIASNRGAYEHSQIIINKSSATYENRLRIVDKSSKAAGTYTCEVANPRGSINESLYIQGKNYAYTDSCSYTL